MDLAVDVRDVTKDFGAFALRDITFAVPEGSILGIIGENGAGKTTLMRILLGLIRPDSGNVCVLGEITGTEPARLSEAVGAVFDEGMFPEELTLSELGGVFSDIYKNWDSALYHALLERFALPEDRKYSEFSRGMKMKAGIAAALSHDPKLLVLDEPTGGLDPMAREQITDLFFDFTRKDDHTVIISSHIVSDLEKLCDYILFIHDGAVTLFDEKDALLERFGILTLPEEQLADLPESAVCGLRRGKYAVTVLVERAAVSSWKPRPASLEDIYLMTQRTEEPR